MAVESLEFASNCNELALSSLNVVSFPAVVVHTGFAINFTPCKGIYLIITDYCSVFFASVLCVAGGLHVRRDPVRISTGWSILLSLIVVIYDFAVCCSFSCILKLY